jgi:hypothetical protein
VYGCHVGSNTSAQEDAMNSTDTRTGWEALGEIHPAHTERITRESNDRAPGTIVVVHNAQRSGFFTGLADNDHATITDSGRTGVNVQHVNGGAHLTVSDKTSVTPVDPAEWTTDEIRAAGAAAASHADHLIEKAYTSANCPLGAPSDDEAALWSLREAKRFRDLAFALGVWLDYTNPDRRPMLTK